MIMYSLLFSQRLFELADLAVIDDCRFSGQAFIDILIASCSVITHILNTVDSVFNIIQIIINIIQSAGNIGSLLNLIIQRIVNIIHLVPCTLNALLSGITPS